MQQPQQNTAPARVPSPFANSIASTAQGGDLAELAAGRALAVREQAEMQTKFLMAQHFKRDTVKCSNAIIDAFTRPSLAEVAQYAYVKGDNTIEGPSIRAAEAIAQEWENFEFGFGETSRGVGPDGIGFSEVKAWARDLQKRTYREATFVQRHWRDTKRGGYALHDEREIYELTANSAQRRVRNCILSLIPGDVIAAAMNQAAITMQAHADTRPETVAALVESFKPYGVTRQHIEQRIQRRLDAITPSQLVQLRKIFASLRDEISTPDAWFDMADGKRLDELNADLGQPGRATETAAPPPARRGRKPAATAPAAEPTAPPPPEPPAEPPVATMPATTMEIRLKRIKECRDLPTLQVIDDEVGDMPDGPDKETLRTALIERDRQLMNAGL